MNLSAENYWRLAKIYPLERKTRRGIVYLRAAQERANAASSCQRAVWTPQSKTFARRCDHPQR